MWRPCRGPRTSRPCRHASRKPAINVRPGMRLSELVEQDSYSYDLAWIFVGGADTSELESRYREALELLPFRFSDIPSGR